MPKGKTHDQISIIVSGPLFFVVLALSDSLLLSLIFIIAFLFGSFMLSPDLDTKSNAYFRWGLLRFIWLPYNIVFKHRSKLSHGLIFSPIIRLFYFLGMLILLIICILSFYNLHYTFYFLSRSFRISTYSNIVISLLAGVVVSNVLHVLLDYSVSFCKKLCHKL